MNWTCAVCGVSSKTNRRRCRKCGNMRWKAMPKRDISELAGPTKRLAPRGLLLARPGKQAPIQDPDGGIECGTCHEIIYRPEGAFNRLAFEEAREKHYSISPECESRKNDSRRDPSSNPTS